MKPNIRRYQGWDIPVHYSGASQKSTNLIINRGEDAREFNPDRWLGDDAARLEKHFIPFSLGYGSCPGQNLGRIELSKICATLVCNYDFSQVDPGQEMRYEAYFGLTAHMPACYVRKQNVRS